MSTTEQLLEAIRILRDKILCEDTIENVSDIVKNIKMMFSELYIALHKTPLEPETIEQTLETSSYTEEEKDTIRNFIQETSRHILQEDLLDDIDRSRGFNLDAVLQGVLYMINHIDTTKVILQDVIELLQSLKTISLLKTEDIELNDEDKAIIENL